MEHTLEDIVIERLEPTKDHPENLCLDNRLDYPEVNELVEAWGYGMQSEETS